MVSVVSVAIIVDVVVVVVVFRVVCVGGLHCWCCDCYSTDVVRVCYDVVVTVVVIVDGEHGTRVVVGCMPGNVDGVIAVAIYVGC